MKKDDKLIFVAIWLMLFIISTYSCQQAEALREISNTLRYHTIKTRNL